MTVEHALCCKVGGLVHIRHDDVADEWRHLCGCALTFGCVEREPRIYSSVSRQQRLDASSDAPSGEEDDLTAPTDQTPPTGKCGDASAHGFWQCGHTAIFDVRITDTQSRSYQNNTTESTCAEGEGEEEPISPSMPRNAEGHHPFSLLCRWHRRERGEE
jgi:hypothetical protein